MSRSIHTTRKIVQDLEKRKAQKGVSRETLNDQIIESRRKLTRKHFLKRQVHAERRYTERPLAGTPVETIPIQVLDSSPYVQYPASAKDVRAILHLLPSEATEGISSIQLCLGKEEINARDEDDDSVRDPFTDRSSYMIFPNVYSGTGLGCYHLRNGKIFLFAYVYDPARLQFPRSVCDLYLRLHGLKTLVHEIAHHFDRSRRVSRGRWLADRRENAEWFAEKMEHEWTLNIVLPYLEKEYPKEVQKLRKWTAFHGGILLPLEFFAGDNRRTERDGLVRIFFSSSSGFEEWVSKQASFPDRNAAYADFAEELHYSELYEECLKVVERILSCSPQNLEALNIKADTLRHLEHYEEALSICKNILQLDSGNISAFEQIAAIFRFKDEWENLLKNCSEREKIPHLSKVDRRMIWLDRATAHCALDHTEEMEHAIQTCLTLRFFPSEEKKRTFLFHLRRRIYARSGKTMPNELKN